MKEREKIFRNLSRFFNFYFCFSGLPINFWYYYLTFWTLKYKFRAEIYFDFFFKIFLNFWGIIRTFGITHSSKIPRGPWRIDFIFLDPEECNFAIPELMGVSKTLLNLSIKLFQSRYLHASWSYHSILLHSGLNPAWHFWLSTRFSCCLKMKSVENILGYIREQFYRFSRGCKPRENLWNCSRKYTKMFKTDSFLGNKKLSFNQNVWRDHATMQQDVLLHFWVIFLY